MRVVSPDGGAAGASDREVHAGDGVLTNSSNPASGLSLDGLRTGPAAAAAIAWLQASGHGQGRVNYKLRDWLFARQRYWGEPFPVVFDESGAAIPLPDELLPVVLPPTDNFKPSGSGDGPLANLTDWVATTVPGTGRPGRRETNTMPQWAGSCWYYLRFLDPRNSKAAVDPELERYWMPVDLYVGGAEHAVLHLLYARFWHKVRPATSPLPGWVGGGAHGREARRVRVSYQAGWVRTNPDRPAARCCSTAAS